MNSMYTAAQFAKLVNVNLKTLQRWDRAGKLKAYRTPTNRRYYTHQQYLDYIGDKPVADSRACVIYARVFHKDMEALNEQLHAVDEFAKAQGVEISNIFSDFGSGVRFSNREEFCNLMDECAAGKIKTIYVADEKCIATIDPQFIIAFLRVQFQVDVVSINAEVIAPLYEVRYEGDIAKRGRYD